MESRVKAISPTINTPTITTYERNTSIGSAASSSTSPRRSRIKPTRNIAPVKMKKCNRRKCETGIFGVMAILLLWLNFHFVQQYPGYHHSKYHISQLPQRQSLKQWNTEPSQITPQTKKGIIQDGRSKQQTQSDNSETQSSPPVISRPRRGAVNPHHRDMTNLLRRKPQGHLAQRRRHNKMEFNWRRSKYAPPPDYIEQSLRQEPPDYWTQLLNSNATALNLTRSTSYLGVLVDAGRHYFELEWLYRLMDLLQLLQYNWVHFRLTDDQTFNLQLNSWPQLAVPTPYRNQTKVYQPEGLRKLVAYAKERNITVIPEINIPGHAGAWAGIPGLVVPCPNFICQKGYGLPLNVNHPQLPQILKDVLVEVLDIFDQPPYLHLGGDEIEMSKPCYEEIRQPFPNYTAFEAMVKGVLKDLNYNESNVIRWEMTLGGADPKGASRAGQILHWWFQIPGEKHQVHTRPNDPFVASSGLYMDANEEDGAWEVFLHARKWLHLNYGYKPQAIVVGTFELDQEFWFDRNVVGKLLATAMGVSNEVQVSNGTELYAAYKQYCTDHLQFPDSVCNKYAKPNLPSVLWKEPKWKNVMWKELREGLCDRLTTSDKISPPGMNRKFRPQFLFPNQVGSAEPS